MRLLITGATGFVGFRLLHYLQKQNHQLLATGRNLHMGQKISELGIEFRAGSLEDPAFVNSLSPNHDAVIHVAGLSSPWGAYEQFHQANVVATQNIVTACLSHQIPRLVHMSTPSLYVSNQDRFNVKESDPLPDKFINAYAATKYLAEQAVLAGHAQGLKTIMLRPRAIIGAGDTVIVPRLLRAHHEGRLRVIGNGQNLVDMTAVSNVCRAVELALEAEGDALGQAYNITNGEPIKLWDTLELAFQKLGLKLNRSKIPFALAYTIAGAMEIAATADPKQVEPALLRYSVIMLARSQSLNIDKARAKLKYEPIQNTEQAMDEFVSWWKTQNESK